MIVTVVVDGRAVASSEPARVECGVTVAPLVPFVRDLAERVELSSDGTRVRIVRGAREVTVRLVRASPSCIVANVPSDTSGIPLAAVARALGGTVAYDARAHVVAIDLVPDPIVSLTPSPYIAPPIGTVPTFEPYVASTPRPQSTGIPKPRRTPILIEPSPQRS